MTNDLEDTAARIARLRVEIGQYHIARRNHIDMCDDEIGKRRREIEVLYEAEQKREAKAKETENAAS